ncbi:MAG: thiamine/thiamine pyrophosphate ABC transporter permease ThiP [Boseongicola sp.]|nr:thiamine/thiamine pyrophosphate ABC transporter permease ThiP [Boseongicola sp.]
MAVRAQPIRPVVWVGGLAALVVPTLILLSIGAVIVAAEPGRGLGPADWAAIRFTLVQAMLSALISVALAIPVARALARRQFRGRGLLVTLLGAPFLLPVIVAVFGLLAVFGRGGFVNAALEASGLPAFSIFGLHGVVLAHVFFNMPLATRLILQGWAELPAERFRLAASLGMDARAIRRHLEWPMLRKVVPGALLLIFVICTTSFAVALILGGGPHATTVELAIYQALRFDFDLTRAAFLSLLQLAITGLAAFAALRWSGLAGVGAALDRPLRRWDAGAPALRLLDAIAIIAASLFLLVPMAMVAFRGLPAIPTLPSAVWTAAFTSLVVAFCSTCLVAMLAISIGLTVTHGGKMARHLEVAGLLAVAASPLVIGTGLFLIIFRFANPTGFALPVTILVNALMTLPFALRALIPAMRNVEADYGRLADTLNLSGWARLRLLVLPRIRRPLGFSLGLAAALSMGDLGVIALFADSDTATLPLQVYRLMGAYRMDDAGAAAVLLLILTFAIFMLFDMGLGRDADA